MANITVSANTTVVNVDSTTNTIQVGTTTSNVVVGETTFVANNIVRAAIDVANNGGDGSLSYDEPTGVITYNGVTAAETRAHFSGSNGVDYNSTTGAITADTAEIRGFLGNTLPITYDNATGVIGFDANLDDLTLKKYQETIVDNGIDLGDISVNINDGTVHQFVASGNITGITLANIAAGGSATIFLTQDGIGDAELDLTTTPGNWTDWKFTTGYTNLSTGPNQWNALNVFYDGTDHYATLITEDSSIVQNSDLANSNVIVNGTTITLGGSGNISNFGALTTSDLTEGTNLYYTTARQNTDFDTRLATKSTTNLTEGTNLYFTNARANTVIGTNTTDNLSEGSTNLYYTNARSRAALAVTNNAPAGTGGLIYSDITGVFTYTPPDLSSAGAVDSVNGQTGVVVLDTDDI